MTRIYLIRHGETEWNREEIFRGRADIPLNRTGRRGARAAARALRNYRIAEIFSSPLSRAWETARPLAADRNLKIIPAPALIDIDFGKWQGIPKEKIRENQARLYRIWEKHPEKMQFPGGESLARVRSRAVKFLRRFSRAAPEQEIALVSHRVVLKLLALSLLGLNNSHFWEVQLDPASVSTFEIPLSGRPRVLCLNDTCHLQDLRSRATGDF